MEVNRKKEINNFFDILEALGEIIKYFHFF